MQYLLRRLFQGAPWRAQWPSFAALQAGASTLAALLWPARTAINWRERTRIVAGAMLGVLLALGLSRGLAGAQAAQAAWLFAPLGASALLVFGMPGSPMAQPWAVVAGNAVSCLVGIAFARLGGDLAWAAPAAVGLAIALMLALRCLHPPGGATALLMVLGHVTSPAFLLAPVLCNSLALVAAGVVYNRWTGRAYPHRQRAAPHAPMPARFSTADVDAVLARHNQLMDVGRDELEELLVEAEAEAWRRQLVELRCGDVMTREPHVVHFGTPLLEAWTLMRRHRIKALPVVDRARRVVGIVTNADFLRLADPEQPLGLATRLRSALQPSGTTHTERPEAVGQIMSREVRVAHENGSLADLIPLFSSSGHHHLPVIDDEQRIVGILTESDLVRSLHRAARPGA